MVLLGVNGGGEVVHDRHVDELVGGVDDAEEGLNVHGPVDGGSKGDKKMWCN